MTTAPSGRRRPARLAAGTALLAVAGMIIGLSACDPEPVDPSPPTTSPSATSTGSVSSSPTSTRTPVPSPTPTSEQDKVEEAIRQAIADYVEVYNEVRTDPDADVGTLKDVAAGELLEIELGFMEEWRAKGWRATKGIQVKNIDVGTIVAKGKRKTVVVTYCVDSTGVDVLDRDGKSVVADGRKDHFPTEMTLEKAEDDPWLPVTRYRGGDACDGM